MTLRSSIEDEVLVVRSVGDQSVEEGFAQLNAGIDMAAEVHQRTGRPCHMLIDLTESTESKNADELELVIDYLAQRCPPLSGRIAIVAPEDLLFGLSRVFSARGAAFGLEAHTFRDPAAARDWL